MRSPISDVQRYMSGIVGVIGNTGPKYASNAIEAMTRTMVQGSNCEIGLQCFSNIQLGWVSRQEAFDACNPIWNETRDVCLIFCGEVYSDVGVLDSLKENGHEIRDLNSATWLVHLFEEDESRFFDDLNGTFSGVIVDRRQPATRVILFNDRLGYHRVYVKDGDGCIYFASEAKALLSIFRDSREIDEKSLGEWLACGCTIENRSLFSSVDILPPGSAWSWTKDAGLIRRSYFSPSVWTTQEALQGEEFFEKLKETFLRITPKYFNGLQKVAMSITGGLDSRMVIAAFDPAPGDLDCYTFGGPLRDSVDVTIGRMVAARCGQDHSVVDIDEEFFSSFSELARQAVLLTDGAMDVSGAASLYVNKKASEIASIRMTGNLGGEVLRGIRGLKPGSMPNTLLSPDVKDLVIAANTRVAGLSCNSNAEFVAFKQIPWFHHAMAVLERSQLVVRTPFLDNEILALSFRAPSNTVLNKAFAFRFVAESAPKLADLPNDRGATWDSIAELEESSSGFRRFCEEFLPKAEYAFDYGMPNWFAKLDRSLSPLKMERWFLGNQKYCHFRSWYRFQLAGFVKEVLLDERSLNRGIVPRRILERLVAKHVKGTENHTLLIHKLVSIELIYDCLLRSN